MLIIIPAYNEEDNIVKIVQQCLDYGEVLVIDDGSTDLTAAAATIAGAKVFSHSENRGYGKALHTGYLLALQSNHQVFVQLDGDGQHDPKYIPEFVREIENGAHVVLGSRFLGDPGYHIPFFRKVGMKFFAFLTSWISGYRFTDTTSGYRAFNRVGLQYCVSNEYPKDYPDANALAMLHWVGLRIREIPVKMRSNGQNRSMHNGLKPVYYVCKMLFTLFHRKLKVRET